MEQQKTSEIALDKNLRALIARRLVKPSNVARELGMTKQTLHNYLYGVIPKSLLSLVRLAQFFETSLDELVFEKPLEFKTLPDGQNIPQRSMKFEITITPKDDL